MPVPPYEYFWAPTLPVTYLQWRRHMLLDESYQINDRDDHSYQISAGAVTGARCYTQCIGIESMAWDGPDTNTRNRRGQRIGAQTGSLQMDGQVSDVHRIDGIPLGGWWMSWDFVTSTITQDETIHGTIYFSDSSDSGLGCLLR